MKVMNVLSMVLLGAMTIGCSLEIESLSLQQPIDDKPVFKKLEKYKITGDFSAEDNLFEEYQSSAMDDEGNLFLLGNLKAGSRFIRGISPDGSDKLNFGQKGYLKPGSAIPILEATSSSPIALSVIRRGSMSQLAVVSYLYMGTWGASKYGLKISFFSKDGKLLGSGDALDLPFNQPYSASIVATDQYIYTAMTTNSDYYITRSDHQGSWDYSFGTNGLLRITKASQNQSTIEEFGEKSPIFLATGANGDIVCHKISPQGTAEEFPLSGTNLSNFKIIKLNNDAVLVVGINYANSNFRVFGVNQDCKALSSVNTTITGYTISDYALAGITRFADDAADIFLVKKAGRAVQKVHINLNNVSNQSSVEFPKMEIAPGRTDTSFNYSIHSNGNDLTLVSFNDYRTFPKPLSSGSTQTKETSIHRFNISSKSLDNLWGINGRRYLNGKTKISLLDLNRTTIAAKNHIYFINSYLDDQFDSGELIYRIGLDGKLDTSFENNGFLNSASTSHIIETDNLEVLLIVRRSQPNYTASYEILKLKKNGQIDTSFGVSGTFEIPSPSRLNTSHFLVKGRSFFFMSAATGSKQFLRSIDLDTGILNIEKEMIGDTVLALSQNNQNEIIVETALSSSPSQPAKVFIHKLSETNGNLNLSKEITFDATFPNAKYPSKGDNAYYLQTVSTFPEVIFNLKTYDTNGNHRSDSSSIFNNLLTGSVSNSLLFNGLPFAYGIFDAGSYFFGRVALYNNQGILHERVFDSIIIHKTLVSQTKQFYMIERVPKLTGDEFNLVVLHDHDFKPYE